MKIEQITKQDAFEAIVSHLEFSKEGKREDGKSFYTKKENGDVTFMFDKRQYGRFELVKKLSDLFIGKNIAGGQLRIDGMTLLYTAVYLEDRKA